MTAIPETSKTEAALQRLEQAVSRLERAVPAAPIGDLFGHDDHAGVRRDYAKLDQASRQVELRLDAMVDRLQDLLES